MKQCNELQSMGTAAETAPRYVNCLACSECTAISGIYQTQNPVSVWQRTILAVASHYFETIYSSPKPTLTGKTAHYFSHV